MHSYEIAVLTCDKYMWAVQPFAHFFNKYWDDQLDVYVFGFSMPTFPLPANFHYISIDPIPWPASEWSDQLLYAIDYLNSPYMVLMLEDYWIRRPVYVEVVELAWKFLVDNPDALKVDLTNDRQQHPYVAWQQFGYCSFRSTPKTTPYQFNVQASIWNTEILRDILPSGLDPWQVEYQMTEKLAKMGNSPSVWGTDVHPVAYEIAMRAQDPYTVHGCQRMNREDVAAIRDMLPGGWSICPR